MGRCLPKAIFAGLSLILLHSIQPAVAGGIYSRDLGCEQKFVDRGLEICRALEREMDWTWKGHAIISPSYRITFESVGRVFCQLPISAEDTTILVDMALSSDSRHDSIEAQVNNGSRFLLALLGQQTLDHFPSLDAIPKDKHLTAEYLKREVHSWFSDSTSIFNPSHRHYILREGCR